MWIYDLRTNQHFTLKRNPLTSDDLKDFVACYKAGQRHKREETERFKSYGYDELVGRDKTNLDIFWLRDESLEDTDRHFQRVSFLHWRAARPSISSPKGVLPRPSKSMSGR